MKRVFKNICITSLIVIFCLGLSGCFPVSSISGGEQYSNPEWAPTYYPGVRYYYLPDIEAYYDLSNQDFVYLDNGQWLFSNALPPMYSGYDLYNGYEIALNIGVYQPWMHHHFYVSNYPRYYYNNMYHNSGNLTIRGFNENEKKPFYTTPEDKVRRTNLSKNSKSVIVPKVTRQPQQPNYYGKNIGSPVKVQPQMRQTRQVAPARVSPGGNQVQGAQGRNSGSERRQ